MPDRAATIGAVARPAAPLTATASARNRGQPRSRSRRDQPGASTTIDAVATTDRAKPASRAIPGSARTRTTIEVASAGTAARCRPVARASRVMAPIAAARRTLGLGVARTTKPASATPATTAWMRRRTARRRRGHRMPRTMIATLAPETAVRWASPARLKSCREQRIERLSCRRRRAPAGDRPAWVRAHGHSQPRGRPGSVPAPRCTAPGPPTRRGGPRIESTASTSSPTRGGEARARVVTVSPARRPRQLLDGAKRRTGAWRCADVVPSVRSVRVACPRTWAPRRGGRPERCRARA